MPFSFNPFTAKLDLTNVSIDGSIAGGTAGSVLFVDASGNLGQDNSNFYWDDTNNQLLVGRNTDASAKLGIRMATTTIDGIDIDGTTNTYQGTNTAPRIIDASRTIANLAEATQLSWNFRGLNISITDNNILTGSVADDNNLNYAAYFAITAPADSPVSWTDGTVGHWGGYFSVTRTGEFTGTSIPLIITGIEANVTSGAGMIFNNAGGSYGPVWYGVRSTISAQPTLTAGSLNSTAYGIYTTVNGNSAGTSIGYGVYIAGVSSFDTNWAFYNNSDVASYTRGEWWINELTGTAMLEVESDGTTVPTAIFRGIASQSVNLITAENSAGTDILQIHPTNAAATPAMIVQNPVDADEAVVSRFMAGNRSVSTNFLGSGIVEFYSVDSNLAQAKYCEIAWDNQVSTASGKYGAFQFRTAFNNAYVQTLILGPASSGGVGADFNAAGGDMDFRVRGDNVAATLYVDGGVDTVTIGSNTSLGLLGVDGHSDEIQLLVQGNATQTNPIATFETSAGTDVVNITTSGITIIGSIQVDSVTNDTGLAHGVYTPTPSSATNLDATPTMSEAQYMRVGNTVTVSGRFTADPTAAAAANFEITLPVASNIGAAEDLAGVAFCGAIAGQGAAIHGVVANDTAEIAWVAGDVTSQTWSYIFSYQVL